MAETMVETKEVTVRVGVTRNLGNYESLRIDYEVGLHVQEGDQGVPQLLDSLRDKLTEKIRTDLESADGGRDWIKRQ